MPKAPKMPRVPPPMPRQSREGAPPPMPRQLHEGVPPPMAQYSRESGSPPMPSRSHEGAPPKRERAQSEIPDLWPSDFGPLETTPPIVILKRQASLLGRKTSHLVEAEVKTASEGNEFVNYFELIAPALDNYRYKLFSVHHGVLLYPSSVHWMSRSLVASSPEQFASTLEKILSSDETKRIVQSLIASSKS